MSIFGLVMGDVATAHDIKSESLGLNRAMEGNIGIGKVAKRRQKLSKLPLSPSPGSLPSIHF